MIFYKRLGTYFLVSCLGLGMGAIDAMAASDDIGKSALLKILNGQTSELTQEEKTWVTDTLGGFQRDGTQRLLLGGGTWLNSGFDGTPVMGSDNQYLTPASSKLERSLVYGVKNIAEGDVYIFGRQAQAVAKKGTGSALSIGYQTKAIGNDSIAIGVHNRTLPEVEDPSLASAGIAIGSKNLANSMSIALGTGAVGSGEFSLAVGNGATAGNPKAIQAYRDNQAYASFLQQYFPTIFGQLNSQQQEVERQKIVDAKLFELNQEWFKSININSYEELLATKDKGEEVLETLAWKYALTSYKVYAPMAIGYQAVASGHYSIAQGVMANALAENSVAIGRTAVATLKGSVALGANSFTQRTDFSDSNSTPYSQVRLSKDGNGKSGVEKETLLGPVVVGGKVLSQGKVVNTNIRQIRYVADATQDTDAVNLRQLRGALFNGIKAGEGVTITPHTDSNSPDYGTITINASGTAPVEQLVAGDNISIKNGVISAKDTTYVAGDNISITPVEGKENTFKISSIVSSGGGTDFSLSGDTGESLHVTTGQTVAISGGAKEVDVHDNIGVRTSSEGVQLRLAKHIQTEEATFSNPDSEYATTINSRGVAIRGANQASVSLSEQGLDNGGQRIRHIADGIAPNDAVSVRQLQHMDRKLKKHASAGVAAAIAASHIPQSMRPGKMMMGIGGGSYAGESAVAIGVSRTSDNGRAVFKISGMTDSNKQYGVGAGFGYEFN